MSDKPPAVATFDEDGRVFVSAQDLTSYFLWLAPRYPQHSEIVYRIAEITSNLKGAKR